MNEVLRGLRGRDLLTIADLDQTEVEALVESAATLKAERGPLRTTLAGRSIAILFFKPSTRTRLSFEVAAYELGAHPLILHSEHLQLGRGETIEDTARVFSRYVHAIVIRTYDQEEIERFAAAASIPVINALTDLYHPVQILSDLLTLKERFGQLKGLSLAYVGDGNNVAHSLMIGGCKVGMDVRIATPADEAPRPEVVERAREIAAAAGGKLTLLTDPHEAVREVHAIYTDTWVSMGQDAERDRKIARLQPYQVNQELLARARPDACVMHCLPAHVGEEITSDVFEGPQSIVFDQAENRLHMQKAILEALLQ